MCVFSPPLISTVYCIAVLSVVTGLIAGRRLLPPTKEEINAFARVSLSVCLSVSKITQKRVR